MNIPDQYVSDTFRLSPFRIRRKIRQYGDLTGRKRLFSFGDEDYFYERRYLLDSGIAHPEWLVLSIHLSLSSFPEMKRPDTDDEFLRDRKVGLT